MQNIFTYLIEMGFAALVGYVFYKFPLSFEVSEADAVVLFCACFWAIRAKSRSRSH